jgi:hypothetical protein
MTNPQVLICATCYESPNPTKLVIAHSLIAITLITSLVWFIMFIKRMTLFPVKERAPHLAVYQCVCFLLTLVIPYISESLLADWAISEDEEIPFSRRFVKAIYMAVRLNCYFVYTLR